MGIMIWEFPDGSAARMPTWRELCRASASVAPPGGSRADGAAKRPEELGHANAEGGQGERGGTSATPTRMRSPAPPPSPKGAGASSQG